MRRLLLLFPSLALGLLAGCPNEGAAPKNTALNRDSHEPHLPIAAGAHAAADCNACHGAFDTFRQFDCLQCHTQAKTDPTHAGTTGYSWDSAACLTCHPKGQAESGPHLRFPIGAGTRHVERACSRCHPGATKAEFTCLTCHDAPATNTSHATMPGYGYDSAKCYACHPAGTAPDHDQFPIGAGTKHVARTCNQCHPGPTLDTFSCLGCHDQPKTDPLHAGMTGYAWESGKCLSCHPKGEAAPHTAFPIGAGTKHVERSCDRCHTGATMKDFTCLTCHLGKDTDPIHATVSGYGYQSPKCYACHPSGTAVVDHAPYFPIAAGAKHAAVACADCHTVPLDKAQVSCNACHTHPAAAMVTPHGQVGGYGSTSELCRRCHADSQVTRVAAHLPFRIVAGTKHYRTSCFDCHPGRRTDKTWATDFARARIDCLACHPKGEMDNQHQGERGYQYVSTTCINGGCHADGSKPGD